MKIRPVAASCCMRTDALTDSTKLTVAFHNFANASKNSQSASKMTPVLQTFLKKHLNTFIVVSMRAKFREKAELWSAKTPCSVDIPTDRLRSNSH